ncbi:MAG: DUF2961 domain-containing protein [Chthonomonadales bacterium]|nr:DUF2961 domain-containing protein [Chthonomonadales bacterium]
MRASRSAWPPRAAIVAALALLATGPRALAGPALTYTDILRQLTDLDRLTRLHEGFRGGIYSSWDRGMQTVWGANGDAAHYLRVEDNGEAVMMDADGPGCIYRIWSANPKGKIRVYLDGARTPTYEWDFDNLFSGDVPPFVKPLVYRRDDRNSAHDCYLPIPYAKHVKVTADQRHGQYYQINYVRYPEGWSVPSFRLPLSADEDAALKSAVEAWRSPGRDPKPRLPDQKSLTQAFTIGPGHTTVLADLKGPGVIRAIRARVSSEQRYAWRKLVLKAVWDGAGWPQVLTPLGPLFGFDWDTAEYGSLIAGCQKGQCYFYYPMPFRHAARLELTSFLEQPAEVSLEIEWAPVAALPGDSLYFYARWRHEPDSTTFDYPFVETAGRGHFVGVTMPIDHPLPGWWGEGDEKVWVDDDAFPPFVGTGSEDYFGDAWGIRYLSEPSFGCSEQTAHRTCNYRWHFTDLIPFDRRLRMTIENYGPNGQGPRGQYDYSSTAFWYQAELTPRFTDLIGKTYIGAPDPGDKPGTLAYNPSVFADVDQNAVRTYGLALTFAQQAEDLFAEAVAAKRARIVTDALRPYELDRERAMEWPAVKAGETLGACLLRASEATVYFPRIVCAPEAGLAEVALEIGGERLRVTGHPEPNVAALAGVSLPKGSRLARLVAVTDGRAVVDCIQLEPATRAANAIEAESLEVPATTGGAPRPEPSAPWQGVSGGRFLEWRASGAGQGFTVRVEPRPDRAYVVGALPVRGPTAGVIQAFVDGQPIGPRYDLHAPERSTVGEVLALGPMPPAGKDLEIRVVDRNAASTGYVVGLDYFRFLPRILGPESAPDVGARVLTVHGGDFSIQDLGAAWSDGHQLWILPSSLGTYVDIVLDIPRDGDYMLDTRLTASWDYAIVQAFLDGTPVGPRVDAYAPEVRLLDPTPLGTVRLTAGRHILRFQAVAKNPASASYLMGIDHVTVREPR